MSEIDLAPLLYQSLIALHTNTRDGVLLSPDALQAIMTKIVPILASTRGAEIDLDHIGNLPCVQVLQLTYVMLQSQIENVDEF